MKTVLFSFGTGLLLLSGCATEQGDVALTHKVTVDIKATNVYGDYAASTLVRQQQQQDVRTVYSKSGIRGYETFEHKQEPVRVGTTFTTDVSFYPLTAQPGALAANTTLKASILVDGVVKSTVLLSSATPANSAGVRSATISATL